jgi:hypothetical protein
MMRTYVLWCAYTTSWLWLFQFETLHASALNLNRIIQLFIKTYKPSSVCLKNRLSLCNLTKIYGDLKKTYLFYTFPRICFHFYFYISLLAMQKHDILFIIKERNRGEKRMKEKCVIITMYLLRNEYNCIFVTYLNLYSTRDLEFLYRIFSIYYKRTYKHIICVYLTSNLDLKTYRFFIPRIPCFFSLPTLFWFKKAWIVE